MNKGYPNKITILIEGKLIFLLSENKNVGIAIVLLRINIEKIQWESFFFRRSNLARTIKAAHQNNTLREKKISNSFSFFSSE